jgi:hypothetical protein
MASLMGESLGEPSLVRRAWFLYIGVLCSLLVHRHLSFANRHPYYRVDVGRRERTSGVGHPFVKAPAAEHRSITRSTPMKGRRLPMLDTRRISSAMACGRRVEMCKWERRKILG